MDVSKLLLPVGAPPKPEDTARDFADQIYAEGKRLYEHGDTMSGEDVRTVGARIKYLTTHLHGKLAGK